MPKVATARIFAPTPRPARRSKAGADHLVHAWHRTYGLPIIVSNCSNNFGPYQCPEKFIPLMILSALRGKPMPIYGRGENVRDWLFVDDHARALAMILQSGRIGECYNVGANNEWRNIDVAAMVCDLVDELAPPLPERNSRRELMTFVADRPATTHAMPSTRARFATSSAGSRKRRSRPRCAAPSNGTSPMRRGPARCGQEQALPSPCEAALVQAPPPTLLQPAAGLRQVQG